jgi:hypothetical protein
MGTKPQTGTNDDSSTTDTTEEVIDPKLGPPPPAPAPAPSSFYPAMQLMAVSVTAASIIFIMEHLMNLIR